MTRIRYTRQGSLLYTDWYTVGPNKIIRGVIDSSDMSYAVVEFDTARLLSGQARSLRHAKDLLRNNLVESGVVFEGEIRKR